MCCVRSATMTVTQLLVYGLDKLDAVAEWVADFEALDAGEGDGVANREPMPGQLVAPRLKVVYLIGDVRFGARPIYVVFRAHVKLLVAHVEPEAAAPLKRRGFVDLAQAEQVTVKRAAFHLRALGDGDLQMMKPPNGH